LASETLNAFVKEPYSTKEQQEDTAISGMWLFLTTEVMFFGGLFAVYAVYRYVYPETFRVMSRYLDVHLGTLNTAILLTSSFTMALAVQAVKRLSKGFIGKLPLYLLATNLFGILFLFIKAKEWIDDYHRGLFPGQWSYRGPEARTSEIFFYVYYAMVGLHALHVLIGIGVISFFTFLAFRRRYSQEHSMPIEVMGLYWHYVDLIWIFLYPLFYLVDPK
jgi:cytochrome c oxidase subunit 3